MRSLLLCLLASCASAQVVLTTGPGIVVTLSAGCTSVPAPTFSPVAGTYNSTQSVTISDSQSPVNIYYTIDGSTPTAASTPYTGPVNVASSLTINAIAVSTGCSSSLIGTSQYVINQSPTGTPTFSPSAGTYATVQNVTVSDLTAGAINYCTTDGSTPIVAVSPVCASPVLINTVGSTTLKAISKAPGFVQSAVASGAYIYQPPAASPAISPAAGTYVSSVSVTITDSCPSSVIYYTTNNTTPTTGSAVYSAPIVLSASANVQAMATCPLYAQSSVVSSQYTIVPPAQAPTPTFSPNGGSFATSVAVTISDTAANATIYYTTDGSIPTVASTSCAAPCGITVSSTEQVRAIAAAAGFSTSAIGSATYTITSPALACPQTQGTLTVNVVTNRANGISPLMIWNDATATTDSGIAANTTTFQDVTYSWDFQDSGSSGTGVWLNGSNPNKNSKGNATGGIGAHLYVTTPGGGDQAVRAKVTATDGTNTVTCLAPVVTVKDSNGVNGFGGAATTCVSSSNSPVAGVGGCPAGATVLKSATFTGALTSTYIGTLKRVLFLCGDTFTGNNVTINGNRWSIGAYGGCEGTQANRPIFNLANGGGLTWAATAFDGRFADIDIEGSGTATNTGKAMQSNGSGLTYPYQITMSNINVNGMFQTFYNFGGHELALVGVTSQGMGNTDGTFINNSENQCLNGSVAFNCGLGGTTYVPSNYASVNYLAILGSLFNGAGAVGGTSNGWETVRISACDLCVIENTTIENAFLGGAVLKFHDGNAGSQSLWTGQPAQFIHISDNLFIGTSGAQIVELAPQNGTDDERVQNVVFERNLIFQNSNDSTHNCRVLADVQNGTFRDNVFNTAAGTTSNFCLQIANRGNTATGTPVISGWPNYVEMYNNTCYGGACIGFSGATFGAPGNNGWGMNNLFYRTSGAVASTVTNTGAGNTVSNNTSTVTNNPSFGNASASFQLMSDYTPSANYSGGTSVPVTYDGFLSSANPYGVAWSPTWDLGAISHTNASNTFNYWTQPTHLGASGGAQGNFYVSGCPNTGNCAPPTDGNLYLDSVEPVQCAGGDDGSPSNSGGFKTNTDASALTGFLSTNEVSYKNTPACNTVVGASLVQYSSGTDTCGAYMDSNDLNGATSGGVHKFGLFCEVWFNSSTGKNPPFTGLVNPFVNYNGVEVLFYLEVPTATFTAPGGNGDTSNDYANSDVSFVDLSGNKVVVSAHVFTNGQTLLTKCSKPVKDTAGSATYELKCSINASADINPFNSANPPYLMGAADSSPEQTVAWGSFAAPNYKYFHWTISQAQFVQGLTDIINLAPRCTSPNVPVGCIPTSFSNDPNVWMIQHYHLNTEGHFATGRFTQGYSFHGTKINFF